MCCCGFKERGIVILIGLWAIIQNVGFIIMSSLGLKAFNCDVSMTGDRLQYLMYLIYFRDAKCGPIDLNYLGISVPIEIQPDMPDVTAIVKRMNIFMIVYLVMSILWTVTSVFLIIGVFITCLGKCGYHLLFKPWIIVCVSILILDLTATGFFIYDITQTTNINSVMDVLEIKNKEEVLLALEDVPPLVFTIPSIIMACVSARGFLFWIINAIMICTVQVVGTRFAKKSITKKKQNARPLRQPDFGYEPQTNNNRVPSSQTRYVDQAQTQYQYDNKNYNDDSNDYSLPRIGQSSNDRISNDQPSNLKNSYDRQQQEHRNVDQHIGGNLLNRSNAYIENNSRQPIVKQNSVNSENNNNGWIQPASRPYMNGNREEKRRSLDQSNKLDDRPYSMRLASIEKEKTIAEEESRSDRNSINVKPPEELRSQLPWSYTQGRDEQVGHVGPKRTFVAIREDEMLPPVPIPDYTLHFPKGKRQAVQNETNGYDQNSNRY